MKLLTLLREIQIKQNITPEEVFDLWDNNSEDNFDILVPDFNEWWFKKGVNVGPLDYLKSLSYGELVKAYKIIKKSLEKNNIQEIQIQKLPSPEEVFELFSILVFTTPSPQMRKTKIFQKFMEKTTDQSTFRLEEYLKLIPKHILYQYYKELKQLKSLT